MLVRVAVAIPSPKTFTYNVPEIHHLAAAVGKRVLVPLGRRQVTGFIMEILSKAPPEQPLKDVLEISDPEPLFDGEDLPFFQWLSDYYLHPLGKVLEELLPAGISVRSDRWLRLGDGVGNRDLHLPAGQESILSYIGGFPKGVSLSSLHRELGKNAYGDLARLEAKGLMVSEDRLRRPAIRPKTERWVSSSAIPPEIRLTARQSALMSLLSCHGAMSVKALQEHSRASIATLRILEKKGLVRLYEQEVSRRPDAVPAIGSREEPVQLNADQAAAVAELSECLHARRFSPCLLHGVTGSGKTEVYLRSIAEVLKAGGGAIYLVPEIALTAQLLTRIGERFSREDIAVLHSGVSVGVRYDQWRRIRRGEIRVVVGARSALFAPVRNLRLIIVDEEHDPSYKQDDRLRYHARDAALMKGRFCQAAVVLGSATPAIQSFFHAAEGRYRGLSLPNRIDHRPLPSVEVVDLRNERDERGLTPLISRTLVEAVRETLAKGQQTLLFLNRRGFHTYLFCPDCGRAFSCPNCDVSLTLHASAGILKCHHCDFTIKSTTRCPGCDGSSLRSQGAGTERVEDQIRTLFPGAAIDRMDSDTTSRKGDSERILGRLDLGEIDILVGTQMITKGHDFPGITLVGVINADASLNLPDFRAAERTFQMLTQVAGRGGRGQQPGRVIVQTFNPGNYAVRRAQTHDYYGFYGEELPLRRQLGYPPFSRLVGLHFSSLKKEEGKSAVARIGIRARKAAAAAAGGRVKVIGPAESPLAKIRGRHRWQLLLKGKDNRLLRAVAQDIMTAAGRDGLEIQVDVDPINFL
jgi:primosomal protein N' (replication factor Y)